MSEISMLPAGSFNAALNDGSAARQVIAGVGVSRSNEAAAGPGPQKTETRDRPPILHAIDPENHWCGFLDFGPFENPQIGTVGNFSGKR